MKSNAARRVSYSWGVTALSTCLYAPLIHAQQVPLAAVEGEVSTPAPEPALFQAQGQASGQVATGTEDAGGSGDFLYRYKPQANTWEVGAFIGPLFISDMNSFRGPTTVNPGAPPTVMPLSTFKPAPEFGLRGGYYPLTFLGGELEGMVAPAATDAGGSATVLAARAQVVVQSPLWSVVPFLVGGVGYWHVSNDVSGNDSDPAFHFGGGAKVNITNNVSVRLDVRDTITNNRGDNSYPHNIEALAGANLVLGRKPEVKDRDGDGVLDDRDQCPVEAGSEPSGCPVRDSDSDGIADPEDQCAMEAGVAPTGCPVRDADQDGVADGEDQCINDKGVAPTGCPDSDMDGFLDHADSCPTVPGTAPDGCLQDKDGDGIVGADDRCPEEAETKNGFEDVDGCPDELPTEVKDFMGVIAGIEFDNGQAEIRPSSTSVLKKALSVLQEYPTLRVEIVGHTDNRGSREYNVELSRQRAESVKAYLVANGVDSTRIQTKGEGPDVPLTTNDTPAGRQKNRRIEFRVLQ